ncbi:hypothetical protein AAG906_005937 [Vitis piasezkii]
MIRQHIRIGYVIIRCDVHKCRVLHPKGVQIGSTPHVLLGNPNGVARIAMHGIAYSTRGGILSSKVKDHLEWQMLGERAPAGHESAKTPIGNESNGVVAGEGANFIVILFQHSGGRLVKLETPHNKELELSLNIMETTPEDQDSHHGHQDNPNEFGSMRDHMHPPRTKQLVIRPHIVPLLPTFHGMESENPYAHIKEFEDVWPRSIRTWTDLQAEFLKKLFPTHRTNSLKRQISNFSAKENEKFYECWERYMEAINACPHHGFDTWLLLKSQGDGMNRTEENYDKKSGGARTKKMHEVQVVAKTPVQVKPCSICQSYEHLVEECPTIQVAREIFGEQANVIG